MSDTVIGILALQGAFAEHQTAIQKLHCKSKITTVLVKTPEDLSRCAALIIPGGESTTIALLARLAGLLDPLREFLKTNPVWGTCAGAILLSKQVMGAKKGGQELLGGMDVVIARNGWGSQVESFEAHLMVEGLKDSKRPFSGMFIRAPVVLALTPGPNAPPIRIVARLTDDLLPPHLDLAAPLTDVPIPATTGIDASINPRTIVALRQGLHFLTTFHPELTQDNRFHEYFVKECVLPLHP